MNGLIFDIGGTNLRLAVTNGHGFSKPVHVPIEKNYQKALQLIARSAAALIGTKKLTGVAGGLPGPLDSKKTMLLQSTHLPGWARKPFARDLGHIFKAPVYLENDNAVVGLGEAIHGAGKGEAIVGYVGIGTGINGCKIDRGMIAPNALGFEIGHHFMNITIAHHRHPSPHPGDWESLVSGSALEVNYGKPAVTIIDKRIWRNMDKLVAIGLANVAMFWSPSIIVVGGSLTKRLSLINIRSEFKNILKIYPIKPKIVFGTLGDYGGLYGALELIKNHA